MRKILAPTIILLSITLAIPFLSPKVYSLHRHSSVFTPHSPIVILSDNDFTPENGVVCGCGIESDPYLISGWEIIGGGDGIKVANTHKYFAIRNNKISNSSFNGIAVNFVDPGTCEISHNIVRHSEGDGILVLGTNQTLICNNDVQFSKSAGIVLRNSHWNRILHNLACHNNWRPFGATAGIYVDASCFNLIVGNRADNNSAVFALGIWLIRWSNSNSILNNVANYNLVGIQIDEYSIGNIVKNNNVIGNANGISILSGSEDNNIRNNLVIHNSLNGILIRDSLGTHISQNDISENLVGIQIESSDKNIIKRNDVTENIKYGISVIFESNNNLIKKNTIRFNGEFDLYWDMTGQGNIWTRNRYESKNW